jgi:L-asparagine transporter-like permease
MNIQWNGQDLLFLYQNITNEIRDFKHKQFIVTNYVILLFIAIVGVFKRLNITNLKNCFFTLIIVIAFVGIYYLFSFHNIMCKNRRRLEKICKKFSKDFWDCLDGIPSNYTSWKYNFSFTMIFIIIILISGILASFYFYSKQDEKEISQMKSPFKNFIVTNKK